MKKGPSISKTASIAMAIMTLLSSCDYDIKIEKNSNSLKEKYSKLLNDIVSDEKTYNSYGSDHLNIHRCEGNFAVRDHGEKSEKISFVLDNSSINVGKDGFFGLKAEERFTSPSKVSEEHIVSKKSLDAEDVIMKIEEELKRCRTKEAELKEENKKIDDAHMSLLDQYGVNSGPLSGFMPNGEYRSFVFDRDGFAFREGQDDSYVYYHKDSNGYWKILTKNGRDLGSPLEVIQKMKKDFKTFKKTF